MKKIKVISIIVFAVLIGINIFSVWSVRQNVVTIDQLFKTANASSEFGMWDTCGTEIFHWYFVGDCSYQTISFIGSTTYSRTTGNDSWYNEGINQFTDYCDGSRIQNMDVQTISCREKRI